MKIQKIAIKNYRSFEDYTISFAENTTVLIGKNGTGKTNLITALKKGLSFIFANNKDFDFNFNSSNGCNVRSFDNWDARFDSLSKLFCFPIDIEYTASFNNDDINWTFYKNKSTGTLYSTKYSEALSSFLSFYNNEKNVSTFPVLAYYSDSYPHIKSNIGEKAKNLIKSDSLPRDFGYYTWDDDTNCAELWQMKFIDLYNKREKMERDIRETREQRAEFVKQREGNRGNTTALTNNIERLDEILKRLHDNQQQRNLNKEVAFITDRIKTFTEPLSNDKSFINQEVEIISISVNQTKIASDFNVSFTFFDGRTMYFEMLPQGYKRLLSIVFDVVTRSYILNGVQEPEGIVIIDEIELHLHPALQQEVLQRLKKTFPKIQFIISTHSPLVISNLPDVDGKSNKIIKLEYNDSHYDNFEVQNIHGIDYNTSLQDIMGVGYRSSEIDNLIDSYVILKVQNMDEEAQKVWDEIFNIVGNSNQLVKDEIELKLTENL